jgi:hypothetical protein
MDRSICATVFSSTSKSSCVLFSIKDGSDQAEEFSKGEAMEEGGVEGGLSELDARVLQSLLEEQPDLAMEVNIKRLLNNKSDSYMNKDANQKKKKKKKYASQLLSKQEENEGWWNEWKVKASTIIESVGIMVRNKIERDIQISLAIPSLFWERVSRNALRTLPTSSSFAAQQQQQREWISKLLLLPPSANSTNDDDNSLYEYLSNPQDKIQSLVSTIQDIMSSTTTTSSKLKLFSRRNDQRRRSLALLLDSDATSSERTQRAYQIRKRFVLDKQKQQQQNPSTIIFQLKDALVDGSNQLQQQTLAPSPGTKTRSFLLSSSSFIVPRLPKLSSSSLSSITSNATPKLTQYISTSSTQNITATTSKGIANTNASSFSPLSSSSSTTTTQQLYSMENTYFATWVDDSSTTGNLEAMYTSDSQLSSSSTSIDNPEYSDATWTFVDVPFEEQPRTLTFTSDPNADASSSSAFRTITDVEVVLVDDQDTSTPSNSKTTTSSSSTNNIPFAEVPSQGETDETDKEMLLTSITLRTFDIIIFLTEQIILVSYLLEAETIIVRSFFYCSSCELGLFTHLIFIFFPLFCRLQYL